MERINGPLAMKRGVGNTTAEPSRSAPESSSLTVFSTSAVRTNVSRGPATSLVVVSATVSVEATVLVLISTVVATSVVVTSSTVDVAMLVDNSTVAVVVVSISAVVDVPIDN